MTDVSDKLREAADYISEHGWCQEALELPDGQVCAMGAMRLVDRGNVFDDWRVSVAAMHAYLEDEGMAGPLKSHKILHPVARWNDAKERTAEDVILGLKRAADAWED